MKQFSLQKYSFGDFLGIVGDTAHPVLAEQRRRIDVDEDMPRLMDACAVGIGDVYIDVGAFIGDTAVPMLDRGAHVVAFEPFLDAYTAMLYNTRGRLIQAFNQPVGNGEAVKLVYECPGPNYGMRRVAACNPEAADVIYTFKLDALLRTGIPKVKLIKIDCEGFEIPTLNGATGLIGRDHPVLYVEHFVGGLEQAGFTAKQLTDTIKDLGYGLEMWGEPPLWDWLCRPL